MGGNHRSFHSESSTSAFNCGVSSGQPRKADAIDIKVAWGTARGDVAKCAALLGYSHAYTFRALRWAGIQPERGRKGATADWNPAHIAALRRAGASLERIAKLRGVGTNTVWKFCRKNGIA